MKKETLYAMLGGFLGFFVLSLLGIHNLFVQAAVMVVVITVLMLYLDKKKKENEAEEEKK